MSSQSVRLIQFFYVSSESGERRMHVDPSLVHISSGGKATVVITNSSLVTQKAWRVTGE